MFSNQLRNLRLQNKMSQKELAERLGVSQQMVTKYEAGKATPSPYAITKLAAIFGVSADFLLGRTTEVYTNRNPREEKLPSNVLPMPKMVKKPMLGDIACGEPILTVQNIEDYVDVPEHIHCDFVLRCKGDSMIEARIFDGDYVYIQQQERVEDGQIAAVLVDDAGESEATLKRVYITEEEIILMPENRLYRPTTYRHEEMNRVRIIGRAVAFTSLVR